MPEHVPLQLRLKLDLAGEALDVWSTPGLDLSFFSERGELFERGNDSPATRLELRERGPNEPPLEEGPPRCWSEGESLVILGGWVRATLVGGTVRAALEPGQGFRPFENVLRFVLARKLLESGGAMIHAGGLVVDGLGVVFPGLSGDGKSTLVLRHPESQRISEDLLAVRRIEGGWFVESLPFHAANRLTIAPRRAPLSGFAFLKKAERVTARRLAIGEYRPRLARSLVMFTPLGLEALALERVIQLSRDVPALELELDRVSPIWPTLRAHLIPACPEETRER